MSAVNIHRIRFHRNTNLSRVILILFHTMYLYTTVCCCCYFFFLRNIRFGISESKIHFMESCFFSFFFFLLLESGRSSSNSQNFHREKQNLSQRVVHQMFSNLACIAHESVTFSTGNDKGVQPVQLYTIHNTSHWWSIHENCSFFFF